MNKAREARLREIISKLTLEEKASLCSGADFWHTKAIERLGIEAIMMSDGPHGLRIEVESGGAGDLSSEPATCFPAASALACSFDRELAREIGLALAAEARAAHVDLLLGPGVNIKRSPLCGRNFEYFSEDPFLAGEMAAAEISGIQSGGVGACLKHYACNNQENRRMVSDSCVDLRALQEIYLEAFRIAIAKSRPYAVMSAYNKVNGEYAGESEYLIRDILRGQMGFDGAVISDWGAVNDRIAGIRAGLDLEMPGKTSDTDRDIIAAVRNDELAEAALDDCVLRILGLIARCRENRPVYKEVNYTFHHELARRAAAESAVLLKNQGNLLPFDDGKPFAIIGYLAQETQFQGGGSSRVNATQKPNALDEAEQRGLNCPYAAGYNPDGSTNDALVSEARRIAVATGRAVIFAGLPPRSESEGFDREDMALPDGILKLIDVVSSACEKTVVYLMTGAPVTLPFADRVPALLCGYYGGQAAGQAAIDVLTGRSGPGGRLAESWPVKPSDVPCAKYYGKNRKIAEYREGIHVGYRYYLATGIEPQFVFGQGLSYTRFRFDGADCDRRTLGEGERAVLTFRVTNTGRRAGAAVVQLYIERKNEPYRRLRQFEKIYLFAGESRIVEMSVGPEDFAVYSNEDGERIIEMGDYVLLLGTSAAEIFFSTGLTVWAGSEHERPAYPSAAEAADLSDEAFSALLGYQPQEPPRTPYTLNSTINELRARSAGKTLYSVIQSTFTANGPEDAEIAAENLRVIGDMPVRAVCALSKGALQKRMARAVVSLANRKLLRGIADALKK